jgi:hypothetical protein
VGEGTIAPVTGRTRAAAPVGARRRPFAGRPPRWLTEVALLGTVEGVYKYGRRLANGRTTAAFHHAHQVWSLERAARLPSERDLQSLLLHSTTLIRAADWIYATAHFPAMLIFLAYMFLARPAHYLWIRRAITVQTLLALAGHLLFPLAPPRMLTGTGLVDTGRVYGPAVYGTPDPHSMANQYAAMPSLHVGWALAIAVGLIAAHRTRWRWLWLLWPATILTVVVGTANHYWLDGIAGSLLLAVGVAVVPRPVRAAGPGHTGRPGRAGRAAPRVRGTGREGARAGSVAAAGAASGAAPRRGTGDAETRAEPVTGVEAAPPDAAPGAPSPVTPR